MKFPPLKGGFFFFTRIRVYSHGLVLWERNPFCLQILELPYWYPVHRESVTIKK